MHPCCMSVAPHNQAGRSNSTSSTHWGGTKTTQTCHTPTLSWIGDDGSRKKPAGSVNSSFRASVSLGTIKRSGIGGRGGNGGDVGVGIVVGRGSMLPQVALASTPGKEALPASKQLEPT